MLSPYNISESTDGDFLFTTTANVVYIVYLLKDQGYFDDYTEFSANVLTFGFAITSNPTRKTPFDERVRITISAIIQAFLRNHPEKVLFFICDNSDSRERFRMKIFNLWYQLLKVDFIEKHNEVMHLDQLEIHFSIILHINNPLKKFIISSFHDLSYTTAEKLKCY
ncbi:DUF6169 family protein [Chitinophaga nivalis]|uniref:DUF6169 family protein n=1 Tax=Chitinophaga nivalis TaxID=2991709 RepID=A0ABT3ITL0_9BACT|nr:DUF6169 family protein [Chitinophaga nivalis]MCW3463265.1 DUF6169 family protein [Chitinophaga nivalis]MCW3487045.1 DUF6169 family protein [Chitinophaga nivalis]